jgi:hypothetical protein
LSRTGLRNAVKHALLLASVRGKLETGHSSVGRCLSSPMVATRYPSRCARDCIHQDPIPATYKKHVVTALIEPQSRQSECGHWMSARYTGRGWLGHGFRNWRLGSCHLMWTGACSHFFAIHIKPLCGDTPAMSHGN